MSTSIKWFIGFLCITCYSLNMHAHVDKNDSLALVAFYNALDGPNWDSTWTLTDPVDSWYGITIGYPNRVIFIQLWGNNLTGMIPQEIGQLTELMALGLSGNHISGGIPAALGNCKKLMGIGLENNNITGSLPDALKNLTNLTSFSVGNNKMTGPIPEWIGDWGKIQFLNLRTNEFSGPLPQRLSNLVELKSLYLYYNQLIGPVPNLKELTKLENLNIYGNQLEGSPDDFLGVYPNMTLISLGSNFMFGKLSAYHFNKDTLTILNIGETLLEDLDDFSAFDFEYFGVEDNRLTFEDILPNIGISDMIYQPQKSIGHPVDTSMQIGDSLVINMNIDPLLTTNKYQWYRDETPWGSTSSQGGLFIYPLTQNHLGAYICTVINPGVPDLILESYPYILNLTTSIENQNRKDILIYPNPVKNYIFIQIDDRNDHQVHLINALGQKLKHVHNFKGPLIVQMEDLNPGVYSVVIDNQRALKVLKL